eukprot:scaffold11351_cov141-Isochrysis_galbana.AAC.8
MRAEGGGKLATLARSHSRERGESASSSRETETETLYKSAQERRQRCRQLLLRHCGCAWQLASAGGWRLVLLR